MVLVAVACSGSQFIREYSTALRCADCPTVPVIRIIDGDTFDSERGMVRLFGVNTPEGGKRCYKSASSDLRQLAGQLVRVESGPRVLDPGGRLLYYVYTEAGNSIDEMLIREGLACAWTRRPASGPPGWAGAGGQGAGCWMLVVKRKGPPTLTSSRIISGPFQEGWCNHVTGENQPWSMGRCQGGRCQTISLPGGMPSSYSSFRQRPASVGRLETVRLDIPMPSRCDEGISHTMSTEIDPLPTSTMVWVKQGGTRCR